MKKHKTPAYQEMDKKIREKYGVALSPEPLKLSDAIRKIRFKRNLSGAELCRKTGGLLDPRTLTAVEKGRIKNPSLQTLQAIAGALGVSVSDLFKASELENPSCFSVGNQKGAFVFEFQRQGIRLVSFTPLIRDFFCGKALFPGRKKIDGSLLGHCAPIYFSVLIGRFEILAEDRKVLLKEGENILFNGSLQYSVQNIMQREGALLLMTAPSLFWKGASF